MNTPADVMAAPGGTVPSNENVKVLATLSTTSVSEAVAVKVSSTSSLVPLSPMAFSTGATLTSFTVTVMSCVSIPPDRSDTETSKMWVPSCSSDGVQVNSPADVMAAPLGSLPVKEYSKMTLSSSTAVTVNDNGLCSSTILGDISSNTGGVSLTVMSVNVIG